MSKKKNIKSRNIYDTLVRTKKSKLFLVILMSVFSNNNIAAQNALINVLTHNSGLAKTGETIYLEVTITNTDAAFPVGQYKIRPQINFPSEIVSIADTGHVIPPGWTIIKNTGSAIILSNGTAILEPGSEYTILIAIRGKKAGGPSTIIGQLSFSDGKAPGTGIGTLLGDDQSDNASTTTIKVIR